MKPDDKVSRRSVVAGAAAAASAFLLEKLPAQVPPAQQLDPSAIPGTATSTLSARSPFEAPVRTNAGILTGASFTPLQDLTGTITPSDLVFERHHSGVPAIDPAKHRLVVHGLVDRSMSFSVDDIRRFPSLTRVYFLECSGNGRTAFRAPKPDMTPQVVDGMMSNGEWTGVPLAVILREAGVRSAATWFLAQGGDSAKVSRSIPIAKAWDDALVAYAFNGEPLRPANGYPVRLLLPGFEGNTCIKWLRRIELIDQPNMSKDETSKYTDPLADGTARQFSFVMDAKSIITSPSHPDKIDPGWREISGLAWSGRGRITRVDVSTDGGARWNRAELDTPVLSKAHTRFRFMWNWRGSEATIMSRAVDETGYVQPTRQAYAATRGIGTDYHFNYIRAWKVGRDGAVSFQA